ncbi:MAG: hypothetical protein D6725_00100 [Planctomycetota bacterium]|nr:MAG: hypothetical protein D6725_00100 [Planctomycetota bacterium]
MGLRPADRPAGKRCGSPSRRKRYDPRDAHGSPQFPNRQNRTGGFGENSAGDVWAVAVAAAAAEMGNLGGMRKAAGGIGTQQRAVARARSVALGTARPML